MFNEMSVKSRDFMTGVSTNAMTSHIFVLRAKGSGLYERPAVAFSKQDRAEFEVCLSCCINL